MQIAMKTRIHLFRFHAKSGVVFNLLETTFWHPTFPKIGLKLHSKLGWHLAMISRRVSKRIWSHLLSICAPKCHPWVTFGRRQGARSGRNDSHGPSRVRLWPQPGALGSQGGSGTPKTTPQTPQNGSLDFSNGVKSLNLAHM